MNDKKARAKNKTTEAPRFERRQLFQAVAALTLGGLVASRLRGDEKTRAVDLEKIEMLQACVGCTGCAASCPHGAIQVGWPMPTLINDRCVRCGFCEVVCPVGGRRVNPRVTVR